MGDWREVQPGQMVGGEEALERLTPLGQRLRRKRFAVELEQVEHHQLGGCFLGELAHSALGRMEPKLERFERQRVTRGNDQLAIEQEALGFELAEYLGDFGEVS